MPSLDNWNENPRVIIQQIYEKHQGRGEWQKEIDDYFSSKLACGAAWTSVVSLNEVPMKDVKNGQLVRFRGMIQDQLGLEMFGSGAILKNQQTGMQRMVTGKYHDELALEGDEEVVNWNETESRQCYYCVPVPGETPWVKQTHCQRFSQLNWKSPEECYGGKKRPLEEEDVEMADSDAKRTRPVNTERVSNSFNMEKLLNFPLPSTESFGCIVKVYTETELMLNQVMEVVGIISFHTPGMLDDKEDFQPPSSIIPRIHCLRLVQWDHNNPLLSQRLMHQWKEESSNILSHAAKTRDELHGLLSEFFKGDALAADYFLCHLASNIYCRKDALSLGKLALNLTNIPLTSSVPGTSFTQMVYRLVEMIVTKAHYLPLSLQNMNTLRLIPKKDYNENRLISGRLQLSTHTHLVLDETSMSEGQLVAEGVRNMTALGNLISWQKTEYDFNFHGVEFTNDVPVLILSERKSLLPCDVLLPLVHSDVRSCREPHLLMEDLGKNIELLNQIRMYLTVIRLTDFKLGSQMEDVVQQDFIQSRIPGKDNPMSPEDFHLLLVLSRLLALTYGHLELTESVWRKAKSMEAERHSRIPATQR